MIRSLQLSAPHSLARRCVAKSRRAAVHPRKPAQVGGVGQRSTFAKSHRFRGVAVVELAICLPLLVFVLLGTIEACHMIHLKQDLSVAAYEGVRIGVLPGSSKTAIETQCNMLMEDRGIKGYSITISSDPKTLTRGQPLTVTVAAPCTQNSLVGAVLYQDKTLTESMVMRVE
ncbi:pilus assembly protein [Rubripirellula amarantea]|nr:pilus assembly protein [Rubripirellula amarantea]